MSGLTNQYLETLCRTVCDKNFLGVFPCDLQPKIHKNKKTFSIIFNTSKHNLKGKHFVAIVANKKQLIYFDSYGNKCSNKYIARFIKHNKCARRYSFNRRTIQSHKSIFCGFFCLGFILSKNKNVKNYVNLFSSTDLDLNDEIVINFIQKFI